MRVRISSFTPNIGSLAQSTEHPALTRRDEGLSPSRSTKVGWQSLAECVGFENRRRATVRGFESHTYLQSSGLGRPAYALLCQGRGASSTLAARTTVRETAHERLITFSFRVQVTASRPFQPDSSMAERRSYKAATTVRFRLGRPRGFSSIG